MEIKINSIRLQDEHAELFERYCKLNGLNFTAAGRMLILRSLRQEMAVLEKIKEIAETGEV